MRPIFRFSQLRRSLKVLIASGVVIVVIFIIGSTTTQGLALIQRPFVALGTWVTNITQGVKTRSALIAENEELKNRIESLAVYQTELEELRTENDSLKLQLDYVRESDFEIVAAKITTRAISPTEATLTIDRGSDDGIKIGQPVIVDEGVIIGKVSEVKAKHAIISLLSDRASQTAATILNQDKTLGLVEGSSGTLLNFQYIPQGTQLDINNVVVTSGLEELVPPNLVIGLVNNIIANDTDPFKQAVVESMVDYRRYSMVSVITGYNHYE